jgi:DNA-binding CsgD family transcriptional regulator/PAS domain-containing protein
MRLARISAKHSGEALVESLYAAAGNQRKWVEVLAELVRQIDAAGAGIILHQPEPKCYSFQANYGIPPESTRLYEVHYAAVDPWFLAGKRKLFEGWVGSGEELIPSSEFRETEFYNDFARQFPIFHQSGAVLKMRGESRAVLTVLRARSQRPFGNRDIKFLRLLYPHFRRTLEIHQRMMDLHDTKNALSLAFDAVPFGIVLLDSRNRVLLVNRAASDICDDTDRLQVLARGIRAEGGQLDRTLQRMIAAAQHPELGNGGGGATRIDRESGSPLIVVVTPLRAGVDSPAGTTVAVFISDSDRTPAAVTEILQSAFGLTSAEAKLAERLIAGSSLAEAAELHGVSINTVRTQLQSLFSKTNTSRQSQLVRLFSNLPAPNTEHLR